MFISLHSTVFIMKIVDFSSLNCSYCSQFASTACKKTHQLALSKQKCFGKTPFVDTTVFLIEAMFSKQRSTQSALRLRTVT